MARSASKKAFRGLQASEPIELRPFKAEGAFMSENQGDPFVEILPDFWSVRTGCLSDRVVLGGLNMRLQMLPLSMAAMPRLERGESLDTF